MGGCRENANFWWWIKKRGLRKTLKHKIWHNKDFWQDTLITHLNRLIGCRILGHRKVCRDEDGLFCFNCYRRIQQLGEIPGTWERSVIGN